MHLKALAAAGLACAALGLSACSGAGASSAGGEPTLAITAPAQGADVRLPVTLEFTSSEDIGPEESGEHHVHVVIDGRTNDYTVVTSTTHQIKDLTPGRHVIGVTLQHADHSPAGASAEVNVNVVGGGGDTGDGGGETGGSGGYGY